MGWCYLLVPPKALASLDHSRLPCDTHIRYSDSLCSDLKLQVLMASKGPTMSPAQKGNSGTPNRLGRRQAVSNLKAAAASSPSPIRPGQLSPKPIGSPQKQSVRSKAAAQDVTSTASKSTISTTRRLSNSVNTLRNAKTPRTISKSLKMPIPATPTNTSTLQKENMMVEDSPLRTRTSASRRATLKKPSKNSIKIKELRLVSRKEQIDQDLEKPALHISPSSVPKAASGRIKLRPKSTTLDVVMNTEASFERPSTIRQTTSGLNIHNLATSSSCRNAEIAGVEPSAKEVSYITVGNSDVEASAVKLDGLCVLTCTTDSVIPPAEKVITSDSLVCSSSLKALECFSKSESLLGPAGSTPSGAQASTDIESIALDNMTSIHNAEEMPMTIVGNSEQTLKPELETPLSIPTVVLPAIPETDNTDDANVDDRQTLSNTSSSEVSFPRANASIATSHSTATCGSYAPSMCPSTPTKSRSTLAVTPVSKQLPRTAPSTPSSSPGSTFAFYHLLLPFNAQTGKPLDPQQERTQLDLWRLRAGAAGMSGTGPGGLNVGSLGLGLGGSEAKGRSVLERARTFGQTLWSSPQIKQRAERAKRREEVEDKAKELEWVSKKLKIQQESNREDSPIGSPARHMAMAQRFWSARMMDSSFAFTE